MYDKDLAREVLIQIHQATKKILRRFEPIRSTDDFTNSEAGMEKLDSICMQLIAVGESLKKRDKMTQKSLLSKFPVIEWKKIMGMRDIISHHYFDVDAEVIYDVCENHVEDLAATIGKMLDEIDATDRCRPEGI
jgi:uncharacterized protein with HEPN domain